MSVELPRDRNGNPIVLLPDGSTATYTRASQIGDVLDDKTALSIWGERMVLRGVATSEHVRTLLSLADANDDRTLSAIARKAKSEAGAFASSDLGTALHRLTERIDRKELSITDVDPAYQPTIEAYLDTLDRHSLRPVLIETVVVCDEVQSAGTLDRAFLTKSGDVIIGDLKTGKAIYPASLSIPTQLAVYNHSQIYDPMTGGRSSIENLRDDVALVIHLPAREPGKCSLFQVDTRVGYELCRLALDVRRARRERLIAPLRS